MRYPYVLLDLDHTLIDSSAAEDAAFITAATDAGIPDPASHLDDYVAINQGLWRAAERGEMRPDDVRHRRFERFVADAGIDTDPIRMSDSYTEALIHNTRFFPGARDVLDRLADLASLAMVTNGLSDVQRSRIELLDLEGFFDGIVISAEIGHTKPGREIFTEAFLQLGDPDPDAALMVGDSLTSDIRGGNEFGIDTCWYNPAGAEPDDVAPTFVIGSLDQLPDLVATGRLR